MLCMVAYMWSLPSCLGSKGAVVIFRIFLSDLVLSLCIYLTPSVYPALNCFVGREYTSRKMGRWAYVMMLKDMRGQVGIEEQQKERTSFIYSADIYSLAAKS